MTAASILVVDDESDIRETIGEILREEGYQVQVAGDGQEARRRAREQRFDLVFLDIWMPDVDGISLLREWSEQGALQCPVVILSGHGTVETAVEATRLGAVDFIEKPISLARLLRTVEKALEGGAAGRTTTRRGAMPTLQMPVGRSQSMRALHAELQRFAQRSEPLLLIGEPGTARSLLAGQLHAAGPRAARPLVNLVAAAVPDGQAAEVLLGGDQPGVLEQANGGTLLIQEVADLCQDAQRLLSGTLSQGSFVRPGSSGPVPLDLRLVSTAQPGIDVDPSHHGLRTDLYAQLAVLQLSVPPLRERPDDINDLLRFWVEKLVDEERLGFRRFAMAAQNRLRNYPWPGNVREMEALVRRLLVAGGGEEVSLAELERHLKPAALVHEPLVKQDLLALPLREAREHFERAYLTEQLALCGGRVGQLAKRVGMERTHLYRKLRSLGVDFRSAAED
ncbi:MAG: sigma-54-dependent Fis family transcriptional regulator [Chromatiales bacterium]|nr:sigma-54-dependent Fis family transcriptional regulator [Chromatiales bacterium]